MVNDGSKDATGAVIDRYAAMDRRIRAIHKENGGLSDARNAGLAIATGDLISFIDSDDWVEPNFLQTLYEAMVAHHAQIAECAIHLVDEDGKVLRKRGPAKKETLGKTEALGRLILEDGVYQTVWNKLYRREVIEGVLFEKGKCNEDDFWTYQIFDRIDRLALVDQPLYHYLQRSGSIIGVGYHMKRLDGLEARFLQMQYLGKYEELKNLARQQLMLEYIWNLQSVLRHLEGREKIRATAVILEMKKKTPVVPRKKQTLSRKYQLWYFGFLWFPKSVARLRNALKIGL